MAPNDLCVGLEVWGCATSEEANLEASLALQMKLFQ